VDDLDVPLDHLDDGDWVVVDGDEGTVEVLDDGG
jgi:hypothetical protein